MRSSRWDAQGNIYLVAEGEPLTADRVREAAGDTDGILEVLAAGDDWVEIAIWNPDGSRAEISGNGMMERNSFCHSSQRSCTWRNMLPRMAPSCAP